MSGPSTRDPSSLLEGITCGALYSALPADVPISRLQIAAISVERWSSFAPQTDDSDARLEKDVDIYWRWRGVYEWDMAGPLPKSVKGSRHSYLSEMTEKPGRNARDSPVARPRSTEELRKTVPHFLSLGLESHKFQQYRVQPIRSCQLVAGTL